MSQTYSFASLLTPLVFSLNFFLLPSSLFSCNPPLSINYASVQPSILLLLRLVSVLVNCVWICCLFLVFIRLMATELTVFLDLAIPALVSKSLIWIVLLPLYLQSRSSQFHCAKSAISIAPVLTSIVNRLVPFVLQLLRSELETHFYLTWHILGFKTGILIMEESRMAS